MILTHLGLSAADQRSLLTAFRFSHRVKVRVELLDLSSNYLRDISHYVQDGQVTGDTTLLPNRTANLILLDPRKTLPFEADSPSDTALDQRRMFKIWWEIYVDALSDWVSIPVFTGPVTEMYRDGEQVTVYAQGMEAFALGACWDTLHLNAHMRKTDAIRRIMSERGGNPDMSIPDLAARLPRARTLVKQAIPWHVAHKIAASMDRRLFFDGAGVLRLERHTSQTRFSFTGQSHVLSPIQVSYTPTTVNAVFVTGANPRGPKTAITAEAVAPANHLLSPHQLGRNGVPLFKAQFVTDASLKTRAEAQARADRLLADGLAQSVQVQFDSIPMPLLDLGDMCHVHTDDGDVSFRFSQFVLPLRAGDGGGISATGNPMTVGFVKRHRKLHPKIAGVRAQHHARARRAKIA